MYSARSSRRPISRKRQACPRVMLSIESPLIAARAITTRFKSPESAPSRLGPVMPCARRTSSATCAKVRQVSVEMRSPNRARDAVRLGDRGLERARGLTVEHRRQETALGRREPPGARLGIVSFFGALGEGTCVCSTRTAKSASSSAVCSGSVAPF